MRPLVLLSNDDGYDAAGLLSLRNALLASCEVIVCAPRTNQSAASHALTLHSVLRLSRVEDGIFAVDGTPADCVYVALHSGTRILPRRPDMVVSGINHGPNLGVDVVYSGTVAAAREGAQRGILGVAISADHRADPEAAAALGAAVVSATWQHYGQAEHAKAPLLNLNIPPGDAWELQPTRLGRRLYQDDVIYRKDPRGREYLWIGGSDVRHDATAGTDTAAWDCGRASITPLRHQLSDPNWDAMCREVADSASPAGTVSIT